MQSATGRYGERSASLTKSKRTHRQHGTLTRMNECNGHTQTPESEVPSSAFSFTTKEQTEQKACVCREEGDRNK